MLTLKDYLEFTGYRITEGEDFQWNCWGEDAYMLSSWDGDQDGVSATVVFDRQKQVVYAMEVHDYRNGNSFRLFNPVHKDAYMKEVALREIDDCAYDDVSFQEVEDSSEFLRLAREIWGTAKGKENISIDLEETEILQLALEAHRQDITLNKLVENMLYNEIITRKNVLT